MKEHTGKLAKTEDNPIFLHFDNEEDVEYYLSPNSTVEILGIHPSSKFITKIGVCVRIVETENEELIDDIIVLDSSIIIWEEL